MIKTKTNYYYYYKKKQLGSRFHAANAVILTLKRSMWIVERSISNQVLSNLNIKHRISNKKQKILFLNICYIKSIAKTKRYKTSFL